MEVKCVDASKEDTCILFWVHVINLPKLRNRKHTNIIILVFNNL